jgi:hypothetical protein
VNGSTTGTVTPTLAFTLADPDVADTVQYRVQIDDSSDFLSPVVDYTSALDSQGAKTFQVGQVTGSGSYTVGSVSQTLSSGSYYWRVKVIDSNAAASSYSVANAGSVAFVVDATVHYLSFRDAAASGLENVTATSVKILLHAAHFEDVTVNYTVSGGTATGLGADYTLTAGTATITAGDTSTTIPLAITDDSIDEPNETIILTLSSPTYATIGSNTSTTYTITDNDTAGVTLAESLSSTAVTEGGSSDSYTIVLDSQPTSTVRITLSASADISLSTSTIDFTSSNWDSPVTVTVTAVDDSAVESTETHTILHTVSVPSGFAYGYSDTPPSVSDVVVTVTDNDIAPAATVVNSGGGATSAGSGNGTGALALPATFSFTPLSSSAPSQPVVSSVSPVANPSLSNHLPPSSSQESRLAVQTDARVFGLSLSSSLQGDLAPFIEVGTTDVTRRLGVGERRALLRDWFDTMRLSPSSVQVVTMDLERMASGQIPVTRNVSQERVQLTRVRQTFRSIFGHDPVFARPQENLAWNTLMYRIRFPRNLVAEQQGIVEFRRLFGRAPVDPFQWATVRVLGYIE